MVNKHCVAVFRINVKYFRRQNMVIVLFLSEIRTSCGVKLPVGLQTRMVLPPGEQV